MGNLLETPITFGEVPTVRTAEELGTAAGQLLTAHYACLLDLDAECLAAVESEHSAADPSLRALRQALEDADPDRYWMHGGTHELRVTPDSDAGMHVDPMLPGMVSVGYHQTEPGNGGFEATFASPTCQYADDKHADRLTELLRRGLTDSRYAEPASFRRIQRTDGGTLVFSFIYPGALPQLHDFRTTSDTRYSRATVLEGY